MKRSRGIQKPKIVKNITINVNSTIHNYFAPQAGPTAAPEGGEAPLQELFGKFDTQILWKDTHPNMKRKVYVCVKSDSKGGLRGECSNCATSGLKPIADFAPADSTNTKRQLADFNEAVADYDKAYKAGNVEEAREARERVAETRRGRCPPCAETAAKLSPAVRACKDFWIAIRQEKCEEHDGCMKPDCPWKGANRDWRVLQADHIDPKGLVNPENKKVHAVSHYVWWPCKERGGVPAMRAEAAKCQWICGFCHFLEPTSSSARRCGDPDDMPDGKSSGTKEEVDQYHAKYRAKMVYPKQQYVDAEKLRRGSCVQCKREVMPETCAAFQFDHIDETTKMKGEATLAGKNGGVGGLVHNCAKRAALDKIKDVLDAEMALCRLLCANCHKLKTWDNEDAASDDEDDEE